MKYILGVLGVLLLLILAFVFVSNLGDDDSSAPAPETATKVVDYADKDSTVSHTTIGKTVSEEDHHDIRIIVSANERRLEIINGYNGTVGSSQSFPGDKAAYETFLSAIGGQGFTSSKETTISDPRSVCPMGKRYVYDLSENGKTASNLWSNTCGKEGNFAGNASSIRSLFQAQIPDYQTLVKGVQL